MLCKQADIWEKQRDVHGKKFASWSGAASNFTVLSFLGYVCTCGISAVAFEQTQQEEKESERKERKAARHPAFLAGWQNHFRVELIGGRVSATGRIVFGLLKDGMIDAPRTYTREAKGEGRNSNKNDALTTHPFLESVVDVANVLLVKAQERDEVVASAAIAALARLARIPTVRRHLPLLASRSGSLVDCQVSSDGVWVGLVFALHIHMIKAKTLYHNST